LVGDAARVMAMQRLRPAILLAAVLALAAMARQVVLGQVPGVPPAAAGIESLQGYLVQSVCLDAGGAITNRLPTDADCDRSRPQTEDDPVKWRKHDWGGTNGPLRGWQATDAVLARRNGVAFIDQTFDFGAPATDNAGHADIFFQFDTNDGGDAIMIVGDTASVFLTQDGGSHGLQWFAGPGCGGGGPEHYLAWLLFKSDATNDWRSMVAQLLDQHEDTCPAKFAPAFTRYRLVSETFPLQRVEPAGAAATRNVALPTVVVEHYDRRSFEEARAMERFYFARGLGKVRWESWSTDDKWATQAANFAASGRCAAVADSVPPAAGWRMIDCRMWTNIVIDATPPGWRVRDFNWPPADLVLRH
jgi:hypothetical protein